jgi:hypothetical protein
MADVSKVPFRTFNVSKGTFRASPGPRPDPTRPTYADTAPATERCGVQQPSGEVTPDQGLFGGGGGQERGQAPAQCR